MVLSFLGCLFFQEWSLLLESLEELYQWLKMLRMVHMRLIFYFWSPALFQRFEIAENFEKLIIPIILLMLNHHLFVIFSTPLFTFEIAAFFQGYIHHVCKFETDMHNDLTHATEKVALMLHLFLKLAYCLPQMSIRLSQKFHLG